MSYGLTATLGLVAGTRDVNDQFVRPTAQSRFFQRSCERIINAPAEEA